MIDVAETILLQCDLRKETILICIKHEINYCYGPIFLCIKHPAFLPFHFCK